MFVNGVCDPLFFFPTFYSVKSLLTGLPLGCTPTQCVGNGLGDYRRNYLQDWLNSWAMWVPGHCVTANLAPHMRIPWVAVVSFGYCCVLSATRGEILSDARCSVAPAMVSAAVVARDNPQGAPVAVIASSTIAPRRRLTSSNVALAEPES